MEHSLGGWSREATMKVFGQQCLSSTPLQLHVQIEMQTKLTPVHVTRTSLWSLQSFLWWHGGKGGWRQPRGPSQGEWEEWEWFTAWRVMR